MVRGKTQVSKSVHSKKASVSAPGNKLASTGSPGVASSKGVKKAAFTAISCSACGNVLGDDVKALQCDGCQSTGSWKCIECLNMSSEIYDELLSETSCNLKWFCDKCELCDRPSMKDDVDKSTNDTKIDSLLALVES